MSTMRSSTGRAQSLTSESGSALSTATATVPPPLNAHNSTPPRSPKSRFYLPSPTTTTNTNPLSRVASRHLALSVPTSPRRGSSDGQGHRRSKSSLAALRGALQTYQIPLDPEVECKVGSDVSELELERSEYGYIHGQGHGGGSARLGLMSPFGTPVGDSMMDALVDIHRVLYRGREDRTDSQNDGETWDEGKEVQRVVERWFEGDCLYDHPVIALTSRETILSHFILLHILSTVHLPSITPSGLVQHARTITAAFKDRLLGTDHEFGLAEPRPTMSTKGKEKQRAWSEELGLGTRDLNDAKGRESGWWKAWDVSSDCKEIGGMECYDGYHLALIEQTITLTLFPSLSTRNRSISSIPSSPATYASDIEPLPPLTARISPPPFLTRLAQAMAEEFDYFLHWDLPISTLVEFNEVGKATRIRDVVDVKDAIETFVPFAKRFGWLTRRVAGLVSSTIGMVVMNLLARPKVVMTDPIRIQSGTNWDPISKPLLDEKLKQEYHYVRGLGLGSLDHDQLGLQNVQPAQGQEGLEEEAGSVISSMAPDCDDEPLDL